MSKYQQIKFFIMLLKNSKWFRKADYLNNKII